MSKIINIIIASVFIYSAYDLIWGHNWYIRLFVSICCVFTAYNTINETINPSSKTDELDRILTELINELEHNDEK